MLLLDANLLVYAHVESLPQHRAAKTWLQDQFDGGIRLGLPWPSLFGFLRVVSNPRIFESAVPLPRAWDLVEEWLDLENVWIPQPTECHRKIFRSLVPDMNGRSKLVPDTHLAALAMEHGLTLCSTDSDFARFNGLRWQNPLEPQAQKRR